MDSKDLLDAVPIGAFIIDREFRVLHWNRTIADWTGVAGTAMLGRPLGEKFPGSENPAYRSRLAGVFEGGPPVIFSAQMHGNFIRACLPDGNLRVQHTIVSAVPADGGPDFHAFVSVQDVSEITKHALNYRKARNEAVEEIKRREAAERELTEKSARLKEAYDQTIKLNSELSALYRTIEQDLNLAGEFQGSLLPDITGHKFVNIACRYFPSRVVSGDIYEVGRNREGDVSFFLGDATGHGITAAFLTMMLHTGFRTLNGRLTTDQAMDSLNKMLVSVETGGKFITGILARITSAGDLSITHAGHHQAILLPKGEGRTIGFDAGGLPLGLFASREGSYREERRKLHVGDRLLLYTDGVTERTNPGAEQFGETRLIELLLGNQEQPLEEWLDSVVRGVEAFASGNPAHDDVTMVGVEYTG
jgi:serine phosphatase RsbU (regulator of sigma subunit)